jgi:very-short-patch-repair endonuclease
MREQLASPDAAVAVVAADQHGVVTLTQLFACGLSKTGVGRRVAAGRLHRVHRGVYAVGHLGLSNEGKWIAAVLACGRGAALSHRSAAELWKLLMPRVRLIHVTVPSYAGRARRSGLVIHRSPSLQNAATTLEDGIAVTTVARTLTDLRGSVPAWELRRAIRQAEFLGLPTGMTTDRTRSDPEADFLRLCRRHRIPRPEVNQKIGRFTVDFLWRRQRLIVETDAWTTHRGSQAFEDDHQRDLELTALGYRVLRFTAAQIRHQPAAIATALRPELGLASLDR